MDNYLVYLEIVREMCFWLKLLKNYGLKSKCYIIFKVIYKD